MLDNEKFFDQISDYYNDMINFDKALANRKKALSGFITPDMNTAVDLGCGTGLDSISLALNNLQVTSFDISEGMIAKASAKAKSLNLNIDFNKYSLPEIPEAFHNRYDLAVSLGNTLANLDFEQLKLAILKAYKLLKEKGCLLIQILNYEQLLRNNERIVNITEVEERYFLRFYDFLENSINFNILTYLKNDLTKYHLTTTKLFPHSSSTINRLLSDIGFKSIQSYRSFDKNAFEPEGSKDLIIYACK